MPLLDQQQRNNELGRIRIGDQAPGANGRMRPRKLDAFRFTTNNRHAAASVAELFGGEVRDWAGGTQSFEVYTHATSLEIMVPANERALSQDYEMWSGGGCQRRCDSVTEQLTGGPCLCPADRAERRELAKSGQACKPISRVNVILPDVLGVGVWRYQTGSGNSAAELESTTALLEAARQAGAIIPADMRLEQRESRNGTEVRKFNVVVLDVRATLRQLLEGSVGGTLAQALPPPPSSAPQLEAPKAPAPDVESPSPAGAGSRRSRPRVPASAQELADAVRACTDMAALRVLAQQCTAAGWKRETVEDPDGVLEELWDLLRSRRDELAAQVPA